LVTQLYAGQITFERSGNPWLRSLPWLLSQRVSESLRWFIASIIDILWFSQKPRPRFICCHEEDMSSELVLVGWKVTMFKQAYISSLRGFESNDSMKL
jgi:hypothetical protein